MDFTLIKQRVRNRAVSSVQESFFCYKKKKSVRGEHGVKSRCELLFTNWDLTSVFEWSPCQIKVLFDITKHLGPAFIVNGSRSRSTKRALIYNDVPEAYTCTENRCIFITTCYKWLVWPACPHVLISSEYFLQRWITEEALVTIMR